MNKQIKEKIMTKKFDDPVLALNAIAELRFRSKEVPLDDHIITVRTLGAKDETDTFVECMSLWGQAMIYRHKIETLCRAITHIDSISLEKVDTTEKRIIIESWSQQVVDDLYIEYAKLLGVTDEFFEKLRMTAETNVIGFKEAQAKDKEIKTDEKEKV
jgi:hypothetical protein